MRKTPAGRQHLLQGALSGLTWQEEPMSEGMGSKMHALIRV